MTEPDSMHDSETEGLPPFVKSWRQMYLIITAVLVLLIVLFYAFMIHFQ